MVAPGANPARIALKFDGAKTMVIDEVGHLMLHTSAGDLVQQAPVIYQDIDGLSPPPPIPVFSRSAASRPANCR